MPYITAQQINTGSYIANTALFDLGLLQTVDVTSPEFKELLVRLYQQVNNISLALNTKTSGYYIQEEFVTGNLYYNLTSTDPLKLRPEFRKVVDTGALAAGMNTTAHGLTIESTWTFNYIIGAATDFGTNNYYPLPFSSAAGNNIELRLDATNVVIDNNSGVTFASSRVIISYLKE